MGDKMNKFFDKTKRIRVRKKAVSLITALALLVVALPVDSIVQDIVDHISMVAKAEGDTITARATTVTFNSLNDFVAYSKDYAEGTTTVDDNEIPNYEYYSKDIITFSFNSGASKVFPSGYVSLGHEDIPFDGKIIFNSPESSFDFAMYNTLFTNVTDNVKITNSANSNDFQLEIKRKKTPNEDGSGDETDVRLSPLFAKMVTHTGSGGTKWSIKSSSYSDGVNNIPYDFSGLIGKVGIDVTATINYVNNSNIDTRNANIIDASSDENDDGLSGSDVGMIAGFMDYNSHINLTLSGTNTKCSITSNNGNAGGLIGAMRPGSELTIQSISYVPDSSRTITTASGYAGGLVGYSEGAKITEPASGTVTVNGIIASDEGGSVGGLYGYFLSPLTNIELEDGYVISEPTPINASIAVSKYSLNVSVISNSISGGLFGQLENRAGITVSGGSLTVTNDENSGGDFGGICGQYTTDSLSNEFEISGITINTSSTVSTDNYGGIIGQICENQPAYIKASSVTHTSTGGSDDTTCFGGIVGDTGSQGSMLDIGTATISTSGTQFNGGGIVGKLENGVLRLSGTTTMTNAPVKASDSSYGQLVGIRDQALVYALGTGNSGDTGWSFIRSTHDVRADDIGTWGEVVRIADIEGKAAQGDNPAVEAIIEYNGTAHTAKINSAVISMTTNRDFVRTALNMQLNKGNIGSLLFKDTTNNQTQLLSSSTTLTFSSNIDLSNTGLTGLMRDDCLDSNEKFCGKITASSAKTITLAIGQQYGTNAGTYGGIICGHRYNGLLARTGTGASVTNVSIDGTIDVKGFRDNTYIGGVAAEATDGITLTGINASETINSKTANVRIGGYVGVISSDNSSNIVISGTKPIIAPVINNTAKLGTHSIAGAIGYVASNKSFSINITNAEVSATISNSGTIDAIDHSHMAGLIADIVSNSSDNRTINLTDVSIKGTTISNNASKTSGGILGYNWYNTNVNFSGLTLVKKESTNNSITTNANDIGGLVYKATGHWIVLQNGITIKSLKDLRSSGTSFGMLVNSGYADISNTRYGLYIDLTHENSYTLHDTVSESGLEADGDVAVIDCSVYDEFMAYCGHGDNLTNKNGVVSITTSSVSNVPTLLTSGTTCNTYQNKYNKTNVNKYTRYYYNLNYIKNNLSNDNGGKSDAKKLLFWSLDNYAADNIKSNFTGGSISGNCDMANISYYPVDVGNVTIANDLNLKFYNSEIETLENASTGNTDGNVRSTRSTSKSQHYLMHAGLFLNATGAVETKGNVRFIGNIASDSTYSGVFIKGKLSGSLKTASNKVIVFEGLTMSDSSGALFINKIEGTNQSVQINGIRTGGLGFDGNSKTSETAYSADVKVAGSLIGNVTATYLTLKFNKIKLDARTSSGSSSDGYNTTQSIFSNATLLNKLDVDLKSNAEYNFAEIEDWNGTTHWADVTYGKELTSTQEYQTSGVSDEKWYYDDTRALIYASQADKSSGTDFSSGYLPYVHYYHSSVSGAPTPTNILREVKVNVKVTDLTTGCGTYDHPYEIDDSIKLVNVAKMIAGTDDIPKLRLPITVGNAANKYNNHWCHNSSSAETCAEYSLNGSNYTSTASGAATWSKSQVREYLASAYYQITNNITINQSTFPGLGTFGSSGQYAFKGVIVGKNSSTKYKITNQTKSPLISFSTGSVIKDVDVEVVWPKNDPFVSNTNVNASKGDNYSLDNDNFKAYGALIGKIFAGDNIVDNVSVTYDSEHNVTIAAGSQVTDNNNKKAAVASTVFGGYIGAVVDGCVYFRNMSATTATSMGLHVDSVQSNYLYNDVQVDSTLKNTANDSSDTNYDTGNGKKFLHVNPIIGRVINGFAINETDTYRYSEDGKYGDGLDRVTGGSTVTLKNGRKSYSIADVNKDSTIKLQFGKTKSNNDSVFAPDAQSLYIMSGILLSGAGTASTTDGAYNYTTAYNGRYNATRHASYSAIGTTDSAEQTLVENDTVNVNTAIPYIIEHYTQQVSSSYPARTLTGNGNQKLYMYLCALGEQTSEPASNAEDTIYHMPDGFRGLGSFSTDNRNNKNLYLYCFDGRNKTVDMNAVYKHIGQKYDNYYGSEYKFGPGLFLGLRQADGTNSGDRTKTIGNITISGYIAGEAIIPTNGDHSPNQDCSVFVGGIVGHYNGDTINIGNITFNNIHILGTHHTGGIVGYFEEPKNRYINNFQSKGERGLQLEGRSRVGGLVAAVDKGALFVNSLAGASSEFKVASIENVGATTDTRGITQVGGLVGNTWSQNKQILIKNVHIVAKDDNSCIKCSSDNINNSNTNINKHALAGGFVGSVGKCGYLMIVNCSIDGVSIEGISAGGLVGGNYNNNNKSDINNGYVKLYDCSVNNCNIIGKQYAGGLLGYDEENNEKYLSTNTEFRDPVETTKIYNNDIDGCLVSNCMIKHTGDNASYASGGLVGSYTPSSVKVRTVCNSRVDNCSIDNPNSNNGCLGGIVGRTGNTKIYGYNLAVNDLSFKKGTNAASGDLLKQTGNLLGKVQAGEINLIGVTRQGALVPEKTSAQNDIDVSSRSTNLKVFIVYSDYNGDSITLYDDANTWGTTDPNTGDNTKSFSEIKAHAEESAKVSTFNDTNNLFKSTTTNRFPFVNVSPYTVMGKDNSGAVNEVLNGDGAKTYSVGNNTYPMMKKITDDRTSSKKYVIPDVYSASGTDPSRMATALEQTDETQNKLSTYNNEMGTLPTNADDFAVVAINSEVQELSTNLINNYIKAVTNTDIDYKSTTDSNNRFKLSIHACTYKNGKYSIDTTATPGLELDSLGNYFMQAAKADTNKGNDQFSLIDVQFLDPTDSSHNRVLMHAYIPVLTKKMLKYGIKTASLSGTDYKYTTDPNYIYGNTLLENTNSWYTAYVTYSYSSDELRSLVASGQGFKWHNDKTLCLDYIETSADGDKLNDDTQIVLVDPNKGTDEYYYSTLSTLRGISSGDDHTTDTLNLSSFTKSISGGDSFTPIDFRELVMNSNVITVEEYSSGDTTGFDYELANGSEDGTVAYKNSNTIVYLKYKGAGTGTHKVTITDGVTENYYLSVLVKSHSQSGKVFFNYKITSPIYLGGDIRARRSDYNELEITNLLMGDLYSQNVSLTVKNNGGDHEKIDETNHTLNLDIVSRINLNGSSTEQERIITHLNSNSSLALWQSFIVDLTAYDYNSVIRSKVLGYPNITAKFSYKSSSNANDTDIDSYSKPNTGWEDQSLPEFSGSGIKLNNHNIKSYLEASRYTYVGARVTIDFEDFEEFPKRTGNESNIGVNVSASSNLSYTEASNAYSNITERPENPDNKYFYVEQNDKATLVFNAIEDVPDIYDKDGLPEKSNNTSQLGLNPKNFVNPLTTRIPIYCSSSYDASKIRSTDFQNAEYIEYSIELFKKVNGSNVEASYQKVDDISQYLDLSNSEGIKIKSNSSSDLYNFDSKFDNSGSDKLIFRAPITTSNFTSESQQKFDANIDFKVKTGADCRDHANYRVVLHVDLVKESNGSYVSLNSNTKVKDWVVYTNAKINPTMLSITEAAG